MIDEKLDAASAAGLEAANKVFRFQPVSDPPGADEKKQGGHKMSDQLNGVITDKNVNGNRYAFKVDGKWASCFTRPDTPSDAIALLKDLSPGDTVTFSVYESRGFVNISEVIDHTKGDPSKAPAPDKPMSASFAPRPGGRGSGYRPDDKRPSLVTMTLSYAKDQVQAVLAGDEMRTADPDRAIKWAEEQTLRLSRVYLDHAIAQLKAMGWDGKV